jgi:hypothetical protein
VGGMRHEGDVREVFRLAAHGLSQAAIAREVGISRATVGDWLSHGQASVLERPMRLHGHQQERHDAATCPRIEALDYAAYAYLLGQYLGDGCISPNGRSYKLRISTSDAYPNIRAETVAAVRTVVPDRHVGFIPQIGCTEVHMTFVHWPCLLPHGPAPKHTRTIVLAPWQRSIAIDAHPSALVRGLIHSDGCRCINRVTSPRGKTYEYVRYLLTNKSIEIQNLFLEACGRLGIAARPNNRHSVSVARRDAVERMDAIVGPKS